ncbi:hypothetical protein G7Y89_g8214 [Cudoniella acicularis]|uniref:Uncharacterized protein n=1 Tax=Cudoniella acicularis TaxID=354080 RepID=A0A8H4RKN1_9HELO|nr:hypothetical protein G7Y89_g8214 [Cudoniella acicularis]
MKTVLAFFALCSLATALTCNRNNCNRAIYGTPVVATRIADCSSYFLTTVTEPASTNTVTQTVYTISGNDQYVPPVTPRSPAATTTPATVAPTAIPLYGAPISAIWSLACSCAGITASTTFVTASGAATTTSTTTVTVSSFEIQASATALTPNIKYLVPDESTTDSNYLGP